MYHLYTHVKGKNGVPMSKKLGTRQQLRGVLHFSGNTLHMGQCSLCPQLTLEFDEQTFVS